MNGSGFDSGDPAGADAQAILIRDHRDSRHVRSTPPVALVTAATIFSETPAISSSVRVWSAACRVTLKASDFLPAPSAPPSKRSKSVTDWISVLSAPLA